MTEKAIPRTRVWALGLDGATFDLIRPWAKDGHLPVLGRLIKGGGCGDLLSTFPPLTGPAWSSFMTGKSPARHGVLEFFRRKPGSYIQVLNTYRDLDGASLWRRLSDAGMQVGVIGVPLTYPPEPVNGFMISGLLTPADRRDFTYPPSLLEEIEDHLGEYRLRHDEKYRRSDPLPFIREQYEIMDNNIQAALYLMRKQPWDFFMLHLLGSDRMQHEFWHLLDPSHPQHDLEERQRHGNVVLSFFKHMDASIGRLIDALDNDVVIVIMSDHGFGPVSKFVNFNTWLLQEGLLCLKSDLWTRFRAMLFRLGFSYSTAAHWVLRVGLGRRAVRLGRSRREELQRRIFLSLDDVDWSRSKVFSLGNFGQLYVNLKGRDPQGIVSPGAEYETLLDDLTRRLRAMADPETGQPVIGEIYRREDIYDGPYAAESPDLMFLTRNMEYKAMGLSDFSSRRIFDQVYGTTGHHRMNGLMLWHGPGVVKEGEWFEGARIQDLAPTILYLMGLPVPREMDGHVLLDLFTPEFRERNKVIYGKATANHGETSDSVYSDREEAEMREMLEALGYVT